MTNVMPATGAGIRRIQDHLRRQAYHHDSLEDVSDNEEDEDSGDESQSYDSRGNAIPSVDVEYSWDGMSDTVDYSGILNFAIAYGR
jgi:hypothetical protein